MTSSVSSNTPGSPPNNPSIENANESPTTQHSNTGNLILRSVSRLLTATQTPNSPNTTTPRLGPGTHVSPIPTTIRLGPGTHLFPSSTTIRLGPGTHLFPSSTTLRPGPGTHLFVEPPPNLPVEESNQESIGSRTNGSSLAIAITPNRSRQNSEILGPFNRTSSNENNS